MTGLMSTILACSFCMLVPDMRNCELTMHTVAAQLQGNAQGSAAHLAMCIVPILQALAEAFRVSKGVTEVCLGDKKFGDEGLKARALQQGAVAGGAVGTMGKLFT